MPMDPHRKHYVTGAIAIAASLAGAAGINRATPPQVKHEIVRQVQVSAKWAYPALTDAQQMQIGIAIGGNDHGILHGAKVEIFCGGSWCNDLAEDLDAVMDRAGADSAHLRPMFDATDKAGKPIAGLGIAPDDPRTRAIAAALKSATNGALDLHVLAELQPGQKPGGPIVILLGRVPRGGK